MDDEGAGDVSIHRPPSLQTSLAPCQPAEGSIGTMANNSGVTLSYGAADATEAKANPSSLDWHHGEKQLMEARNELDEVIPNTEQSSNESMDNRLLIHEKDATQTTYQDQASADSAPCLMETCRDEAEKYTLDNSSGHEESDEEPEMIVISSEEEDAEREKHPQQTTSNIKEYSENETCYDKEGDKKKYEDNHLDETDFKLSQDNLESEHAESSSSTQPDISANQNDFESSEAAKLCECSQNMTSEAKSQPQVVNFSVDVANDIEGHVDSRSLDYNHTRSDWVRRESGPNEIQISQPSLSKGLEEMVEQVDGGKRIATDIQQGEQLLQRLQMVQLRHDEVINIPQEVVKVESSEGEVGIGTEIEARRLSGFVTGEEAKEESRVHSPTEEETMTSLSENVQNERTEHQHVIAKVGASSSTMTEQSENELEAGGSEDEESDSLLDSDLLPTDTRETSCAEVPLMPAGHRFSAAETSTEKQIHEAVQGKQNLQRSEGVFNLADNPDVLEIPFKTNFSLESLLTQACTSHHGQWQFSEKKMKKEISQDIQRELVLVNQGRIPGGYNKGDSRQLKETKLLFEAFHQDSTEGPTRHRKPQTSVMKGNVYPSVLERTHSLEMFSQKSCPISRAHSLRLYNSATSEKDKSAENLRSWSPTGAYQDKTRLTPYPKQDKHQRLHRSMDSICNEASALSVETKGKMKGGKARQESPILKHNPFFKLRPALALQPEVEKDIREAREREEELRRQRCSLYGESRQKSEDEEQSQYSETLTSG